MKKITICLIVVLLAMFVTSCGERIAPQVDRLEELKEQYDPIGVGHNMALDELYRVYSVKKIEQNGHLNYSECIKLAEDQFGFSNTGHRNIAGEITALLDHEQIFAKACVNAEIIEVLSDSIEIMAKYPQVFDSISVILDASISNEEKTVKLENMYLYVDDEIENAQDKEAVLNGIATTGHAMSYWDENMTSWQETLTEGIAKPTIGIIGAIGIIDGAGAVIGTLEGIRDTYKGQDGRLEIIAGRTIGEAAKTSAYAVLAIIMI